MLRRCLLGLFGLLFATTLFAESALVGKTRLVVGKVIVAREGQELSASIGMDIYSDDRIRTAAADKMSITLLDRNVVNIAGGQDVPVRDLVRDLFEGKPRRAWNTFTKILRDKGNTATAIACMGARGILDDSSVSHSLDEVEEQLRLSEDPAEKTELLQIKADLLIEKGNYSGAEDCLREIVKIGTEAAAAAAQGGLQLLEVLRSPISVVPFTGSNTDLNDSAYNVVVSEMAHSGMLKLVERARLDAILSEWELSVSDMASSDDAVKVGELLSARYLLNGTLHSFGESFTMSMRLLDVESGIIVDGWNIEGQVEQHGYYCKQIAATAHKSITGKDIPDQELFSGVEANLGLSDLEGVRVMLGLDKDGTSPVYRNGDRLTIYYKVISDSPGRSYYVTIMSIGPEGEINLLLPNEFHSNNLSRSGDLYTVPEEGARYSLEVYGMPGKNTVIGIVTEQQLTLADNEKLRREIFPSLATVPDAYLSRGIRVSSEASGIDKWKVGKIHFLVSE